MSTKFTLSINTRSDIFQGRAAFEVANILRELADEIAADPAHTGKRADIYDTSGMKAGTFTFDHTDNATTRHPSTHGKESSTP